MCLRTLLPPCLGRTLYSAKMVPSESSVWREVYRDKAFSSYCVTALSTGSGTLALGSLEGLVRLLDLDEQGTPISILCGCFSANECICLPPCTPGCVVQERCWRAHSGKVFSLSWSSLTEGGSEQLLLSCGPEGNMVCNGQLSLPPL